MDCLANGCVYAGGDVCIACGAKGATMRDPMREAFEAVVNGEPGWSWGKERLQYHNDHGDYTDFDVSEAWGWFGEGWQAALASPQVAEALRAAAVDAFSFGVGARDSDDQDMISRAVAAGLARLGVTK